jgi:hypothetical protein
VGRAATRQHSFADSFAGLLRHRTSTPPPTAACCGCRSPLNEALAMQVLLSEPLLIALCVDHPPGVVGPCPRTRSSLVHSSERAGCHRAENRTRQNGRLSTSKQVRHGGPTAVVTARACSPRSTVSTAARWASSSVAVAAARSTQDRSAVVSSSSPTSRSAGCRPASAAELAAYTSWASMPARSDSRRRASTTGEARALSRAAPPGVDGAARTQTQVGSYICMSRMTSRFRNVGGPSQSSARRPATSEVSLSSELATASS